MPNKTIDATVHQIINQFAQADLHSDDDAFRSWLQKKKADRKLNHRGSSNTTRSVSPSIQPSIPSPQPQPASASAAFQSQFQHQMNSQLYSDREDDNGKENMSRSRTPNQQHQNELDALLVKRARSQQAFMAWVAHKEEQQLALEEAQRRQLQREKEQQLIRQHQEAQRKDRERAAIARWNADKAAALKAAEEAALKSAEEIRIRNDEKRRQCSAAFDQWRRTKQEQLTKQTQAAQQHHPHNNNNNNNNKTMPFVAHSHRWIDIVSPTMSHTHQHLHQKKKSTTNNHPQELLSPPNLYKDYSMYEKMAPNYKIKYPSQVASGGVGLCLNIFETKLCPPPPPPPPTKPPISAPNPRTSTVKRSTVSSCAKRK
ncbi:UNVERIFIED_CONTAM: hypothetical protein HDU68_005825 [Siphonaria sp. JEL0065]|nr:hypothetical protein HDU68_005825 [Siphonaria sp. JEL0065]